MLAINGADLAVRGTAWLAMASYFVGALLLLKTPGSTPRFRGLRWVWAAGCEFYLWHMLAAFHFVHDWSHAEAMQHINEHAIAMTGQSAPLGIWLNYAFLAVWAFDAGWLFFSPNDYLQRAKWISRAIHGFLLFMVINGAIIFAPPAVRWPSVVALSVLAWAWFTNPACERR